MLFCCCNDVIITSGSGANVAVGFGDSMRTMTITDIHVYLKKSMLSKIYNHIVEKYSIWAIQFGDETGFGCAASFLSYDFKVSSDGGLYILTRYKFYDIDIFPYNSHYRVSSGNPLSEIDSEQVSFSSPFDFLATFFDFLRPFIGTVPLRYCSLSKYIPPTSFIVSELEKYVFCFSNINVNRLLKSKGL